MSLRIGADIGGTFTDLVLIDDATGDIRIAKVRTTRDNPDEAVLDGVRQLLTDGEGQAVSQVLHGTTLFTNAVIERKGARTALIATRGFRDAIEIGREHRYDMYDLQMQRPQPIAPRYLRFEVDERVLADGSIRIPLDEASVEALVPRLEEEGVEAVGICLMHGYANDVHERRIAGMLADRMPSLSVTLASELVPELREYERTSTTLVNIYVQGIAEDYLRRLESRLRDEADTAGPLFIMQSNGGLCEVSTAVRFPVRLIESGPAAGALAAASFGERLGLKDLLSFDMGGTTAKACLIIDGEPLIAPDFEVDRQYQFKKGSGLPVKIPVIEMIEIGTGGGSIAQVDALRRLQVGPQSAGSDPGPACYGLSGTRPTVTDADLTLGYLDPSFFLGGDMALDVDAARTAITSHVAEPLGLDQTDAAWGIHQMANESMASAARMHAVERGRDIEDLAIFAFGGAGPVHAYGVARILNATRIIYPLRAGVMSSIGFLTAPLSFDFVRTLTRPLENLDCAEAMDAIRLMEDEGRKVLTPTVAEADIRFDRFADMRYRKQGYEIRVRAPHGELNDAALDQLKTNFEETYKTLYGHIVPDTPIDVVSWRVVASGPEPELSLAARQTDGSGDAADALKGEREIYLPGEKAFVPVPVYDRYLLEPGQTLTGPAIIEEHESTVVINGPGDLMVDQWGNLIAEIPATQEKG